MTSIQVGQCWRLNGIARIIIRHNWYCSIPKQKTSASPKLILAISLIRWMRNLACYSYRECRSIWKHYRWACRTTSVFFLAREYELTSQLYFLRESSQLFDPYIFWINCHKFLQLALCNFLPRYLHFLMIEAWLQVRGQIFEIPWWDLRASTERRRFGGLSKETLETAMAVLKLRVVQERLVLV